jgi:hypothetical protein
MEAGRARGRGAGGRWPRRPCAMDPIGGGGGGGRGLACHSTDAALLGRATRGGRIAGLDRPAALGRQHWSRWSQSALGPVPARARAVPAPLRPRGRTSSPLQLCRVSEVRLGVEGARAGGRGPEAAAPPSPARRPAPTPRANRNRSARKAGWQEEAWEGRTKPRVQEARGAHRAVAASQERRERGLNRPPFAHGTSWVSRTRDAWDRSCFSWVRESCFMDMGPARHVENGKTGAQQATLQRDFHIDLHQ